MMSLDVKALLFHISMTVRRELMLQQFNKKVTERSPVNAFQGVCEPNEVKRNKKRIGHAEDDR